MNSTNYRCRFCDTPLTHSFLDLGMSPLANSYLDAQQAQAKEAFFPLCVYVCEKCLLVQLPTHQSSENIFSDYAYFSSYSDSWLKHAKTYADHMVRTYRFNADSQVVEIASNDGYLLQYFVEIGIPVLGIEPARNVADAAMKAGIPTVVEFFGEQTAIELTREGKHADLLIGNNVLAHVPDLNDFVKGMKIILNPDGIITMEFPHLMRLMEENQFDTIYHEHFSYFSFISVNRVFNEHGLKIFDVEELPTHGGSLRIYASHLENKNRKTDQRVEALFQREYAAGYDQLEHYLNFLPKVYETKRQILSFLIEQKRQGKSLAGYGAPAKGNTLLNYCGIRTDFIDYTVDRSPHKQNHFLPGTHIPIYHPEKIKETRPDFVVILPWNLKDEIIDQMAFIREWGGQFVTLIPDVQIQK
jgi:2-polyprenyl-3-methyl-5-hydroxy-6-metoxy-1,4-benzoquinol methylase